MFLEVKLSNVGLRSRRQMMGALGDLSTIDRAEVQDAPYVIYYVSRFSHAASVTSKLGN